MEDLTHIDFIIVGVTALAVAAAVVIHHEVSRCAISYLNTRNFSKRRRMLTLVFSLLLTHVGQIWMFAYTAYLLLTMSGAGGVFYDFDPGILDLVYLSASTFTTLGYGDIVPHGSIRFLYGTQALTGFTLITWSASLTFLEMQQHWIPNKTRP